MILALETATPVCSVALENASGCRFEKRTDTPRSHSGKLFLFIRELMDEQQFSVKDLSAVLISEGPGSYTGLRIGASGVKGLLFGSDVPLYSVSTLTSLAVSAHQQRPSASTIHAILDARRVHLYHQTFSLSNNGLNPVNEVDLRRIKEVEPMIEPDDVIIGTGLERLRDATREKAHCYDHEHISAQSLIDLYHRRSDEFIQEVSPADFDPNYFTTGQG